MVGARAAAVACNASLIQVRREEVAMAVTVEVLADYRMWRTVDVSPVVRETWVDGRLVHAWLTQVRKTGIDITETRVVAGVLSHNELVPLAE